MPGQENANSNNWRRKTPAGGRKDSDAEHKKKKPRRGGRRNNGNKNANANENQTKQAPVAASPVKQEAPAPAAEASKPANLDYLSDVLFASLDISAKTKRAIVEDLKYERLTNVQNETFPLILEGQDGNGKTIAFLLPVIENMVKEGRRPALSLCWPSLPRAKRLTKFHDFNVACFVGGANIKKDERALTSSAPVDILVATPDVCRRLLDMGFRPDVMRIIGYLPKERQTLLFSATLPASTEELKQVALRKDYSFVDTIDENEADTNVQTEQEYIVCKMEQVIPMVEQVLAEHMKLPAYKVMLFFPTARSAQFMAQLFQAAGFPGVLEIHSRKSQAVRTKTAESFRKGHKVMMFSSDVSARGVDYPDVSLVLQVGLTDRDQYIHRLGRTARAGMKGKGTPLLDKLADLPLGPSKNHSPEKLELSQSRALKVTNSLKSYSDVEKSAQQSYQAWLGFYNSHAKRLKLKLAADYSRIIGLDEVPKLEKKTLKKMNLFGVPGIEPSPYTRDNSSNRNGGRNGGGNRGGYGRR
ncbi:P-loop containing nucleoside triphosphate hydrolase [Phytophthora cactorum]|nr:P-loop containing nucleoside triphosphate hydrolase [Phytophthora cactorum]